MAVINATIGGSTAATEIDAKLRLAGEELNVHVAVPETPVSLADIVPLAQKLADWIAQSATCRQKAEGKAISCRKDCSACCRYLVPLSVPELLRLGCELAVLPSPNREPILSRFDAAMRCIVQAGPPRLPETTTKSPDATISPAGAAGRWYAQLNINCPFLVEEGCGIYSERPIACRQHLVNSNPEFCRGFQPGHGQIVPMSVSVSHGLALLAAEMEQTELESQILLLAVNWLGDNFQRGRRVWPAPLLFDRFVQIIQKLAA